METISNMKLIPINETNKNEAKFAFSIPKYSINPILKMVNAAIVNIPVLITGTMKEQINIPGTVALFLNNLNNHPAIKPANPVFKMHTKMVKNGLMLRNSPLPGKTQIPLIAPSNNPDHGPYKMAPMAIGIKAKLMDIPAMET